MNELNSLRIKKGKAGASKERIDGAAAHIDQPKETTEKTEQKQMKSKQYPYEVYVLRKRVNLSSESSQLYYPRKS